MDGNNNSNNKIPTSFSDSFSVSSPPQLQLPLENVPPQQPAKQTTFQQPQQLPQQDDEGLESGDEDAGPNKKKRKRYHAKKACANCRRAHTACEDERPCKRCRKKGVSCFDAEPETMIQGTPDHLAYLKAATQLGMVNPNLMGALSGFDASTLSAAVNNPMNTPTNMFEQQQQQLQTNTYSDLFASQQALNMAQLKMEVMQLKEYTRKQDQMLSTCISKIAELQKVIVQQTEILGQISQQQSEIQLQRAQQGTFPSFANAPIWFNILPQLQNASSVWDKQQLTFLGCNEAFSKLCNYEPEELKELKLFSFATLRTAPFSEVLMLSLINSGARYAELKALWVIKGGKEIYLKHKLHFEETFVWLEHEKTDIVSDEYRIDEYTHAQTYAVPYDATQTLPTQYLVSGSKRVFEFLDVLSKFKETRKPKHINLQQEDNSK